MQQRTDMAILYRAAIMVLAAGLLAACASTDPVPEEHEPPSPPPAQWEPTDQFVRFLSTTTANMHNRQCDRRVCEYCSPEGKYCASTAFIRASAPAPDADFEYRFARPEGDCHSYVVSAGPRGGWNAPILCTMTPDQMNLETVIIGWTHPQTFTMTVPLERRQR